MKQSKRVVATLMTLLIVLLTFGQTASAVVWDFQTIDKVDKVWEIRFNMALDPSSLTADTVYVLGEQGGKHATTLRSTENGYAVQVSPQTPYKVGERYVLMITGAVKTSDNKFLKIPVEVPFQVINPADHIQAVHSSESIIGWSVTVMTSPDVYSVEIGTEEMEYKGNNRYKITLVDAKPGSTVNIYAYDEAGKEIGKKSYIIK